MIRPSKDLVLTDFGFSFLINRKTGTVDDKKCQYKWMRDKLIAIEKNNKNPMDRVYRIHDHHMQYLSQNLKIFLDHCSATKPEIKDLVALQKQMCSKVDLGDGRVVPQERMKVQALI